MNIIVEGPDGSGKSTLAREFESRGWKIAPRACTSEGGPLSVDETRRWLRDSLLWDRHVIDRHPIFSGYVYDHVLGRETHPGRDKDYLRAALRQSIIVYCRPPSPVIMDTAARSPQLDGVLQNLWRIIDEYDRLFRMIPAIHYDWTRDELPDL